MNGTHAPALLLSLGLAVSAMGEPNQDDMESPMTVRDDHGITLFYTTGIPQEDLAGLKHPDVYGGELIIFWHEFEPEDGRFDWDRVRSDMDLWHAAGKKLDIRLSTAHIGPNFTPAWVFNNHGVRRIGRGKFHDFDSDNHSYVLGKCARVVTRDADDRCVEVLNESDEDAIFLSLVDTASLEPGATYSIQWDYKPIGTAAGRVQLVSPEGELVESFPFASSEAAWTSGSIEIQTPSTSACGVRWIADPDSNFQFDNVNIIRVDEVVPFSRTDFEDGWNDWRPASGSEIVQADAGGKSLRARAGTVGFHPILRNDPARFPLGKGDGVQVRMQVYSEQECQLRLRIVSPEYPIGEIYDVIQEISAGTSQRVVFFSPDFLPSDDCEIIIGLDGPGEVLIDDIERRNWAALVTVFPDYFSPKFTALWDRALRSFAERFAGHPGLGIVSVGGFGRWEEVMLDEDVHGILDDQWLSRGFTQERYLEVIEHWMDRHAELLPGVPLRICIAYGLEMVNDVDWVYRRVAQAAARRGIGLKQNGLSEKYDTWNANTNTSYLYHRYRDDPQVTLTHETGGQIYRNLYDAHGHPTSLLNRSLANHTDYLFLYKPDIFGRNINRHFHTFAEQMGHSRPSVFYAWLGDYSLTNEHSPTPVQYRNNWYGLRQFDAPHATPDVALVDGERVLQTNPANPRIVFDVDDRFQYHGMFGVELSVDYHDQPAGPFQVLVFDNLSRNWRLLGIVHRTGASEFRRAYFHDSLWCRSPRNGGEDVHQDIIVEELQGGPLALRNVELQFVPFPDLKRQVLWSNGDPAGAAVADPSVDAEVAINDMSRACAVSFRVHSPTLDRNNLVARVYSIVGESPTENLLAEKEYYLPADGDEVTVPFVPPSNSSQLRIELRALEGTVGWYLNSAGAPALKVWSYVEERSESEELVPDLKLLNVGESLTCHVTIDKPVSAFEVYLGQSPGTTGTSEDNHAEVDITVTRVLPESSGRIPLATLERVRITDAGYLRIPMETQPPGRFEITVRAHWQECQVGISGDDLSVISLHPVPIQEPRLPRSVAKRENVRNRIAPSKWSIGRGLQEMSRESGSKRLRITQTEPIMELHDLNVLANPRQRFVIELRNETGASMARLFWAGNDDAFAPVRSVLVPLVPNDTVTRHYPVAMEGIESWRGAINRIRLQPVTGSTRHGFVDLGDSWIDEDIAAVAVDFRDGLSALWPAHGGGSVERSADGLRVKLGPEPMRLHMAADDFNVEAESDQVLLIRMRNSSSANKARIAWHTLSRTDINPRRAYEGDHSPAIEFAINPRDDQFRDYTVDLSGHPDWRGHVVGSALFPALDGKRGEELIIQGITVMPASVKGGKDTNP